MFQHLISHTLSIVAMAVAMFAVAGCSKSDVADAGPTDVITLELWDFPHMPETSAYIKRAIAEFEHKHPGVNVRYTRLPWQDGQQKVTLAVLGGQPPDVCCQVSNNISGLIAQNVLEPLNKALAPELDDFYPSYIDAVSFQGNIYAIPWYKACYVMALNLDVFDRFHVDPPRNGRWTYDEFLQKMQALTAQAPAPDYRVGAPAPGATPQSGAPTVQYYGLVTNLGVGEYEAYNIIYNFGGRILRNMPDGTAQAVADQPDFINGLAHLQDLDFRWHVAAPGIGAFTQEQSWKLWKEGGAVGCSIQGGWIINALNTSNREQERANARLAAAGRPQEQQRPFRWMLAAPPTLDANTTPVLASSGLGTFVVFKQKDDKRRELATALALHLIRGEGQKVLKSECVYPSRISAGNPFADDPMIGPIFDLFPNAVITPVVPGGERIDRVFQQEIQKALLRVPGTNTPQATAAQAAKNANAKVEAVLSRAKRRF